MSDLNRKTLNYEQKHWYTYKPDKKKNSDVVQIRIIMCKLSIVKGIAVLVYKFNFNGFKVTGLH